MLNLKLNYASVTSLEIFEYFFQKFEIINFDNYVIT